MAYERRPGSTPANVLCAFDFFQISFAPSRNRRSIASFPAAGISLPTQIVIEMRQRQRRKHVLQLVVMLQTFRDRRRIQQAGAELGKQRMPLIPVTPPQTQAEVTDELELVVSVSFKL